VSEPFESPTPEALFVAAANLAPVPIWVSGMDSRRVFCNQALLSFTGRSLASELGDSWLDGVHPDDRATCRTAHDDAFASREAFEVEYRLRRHDGRYRWMLDWGVPRYDDAGQFAGYLGSCVDVTTQAEARVELARREQQQAAAAELGRRALEGLHVAAVLRQGARSAADALDASVVMVLEVHGDAPDRVFETHAYATDRSSASRAATLTDESFAWDVLSGGRPVVVGDWRDDPRVEARRSAESNGIRSTAAVIIRGSSRPVGLLIAHSPEPESFGPDDLQFLSTVANVLAAAVARGAIEHDLRAREAAARLALDVGGIGAWRWRPGTGEVFLSPELESLVGLDEGTFDGSLDGYFSFVHPDDRGLVARTIEAAAKAGGELRFEYRIFRRDGVVRWLQAIGRVLPTILDVEPEWIGVAIDITARKDADTERERLLVREREAHREAREANQRLGETVARLDTLLAYAPVGFGFLDPQLRLLRANHVLAAFAVRPAEDLVTLELAEVLPDWWEQLEPAFRSVAAELEPVVDIEVHDLAPTEPPVERDTLVSISPVLDPDGLLLGFGLVVVDITERTRNERSARLVGAASELVAESPDLERVVDLAARVAIPDFADSCHVYLCADERDPRRVGISHVDPSVERDLLEADARFPIRPESHPILGPVLERHEPLLVRVVTEAMRDRAARSRTEHEVLDAHDAVSTILAPLRVGDRVVGLMSFTYTGASGRHYEDHDAPLASEIARRVTLAVENARLARLADRATGRLNLLARTSDLLTLELDSGVRVEALARVVLPTFADVCAVYLREDVDRARLVALAHVDAAAEDRFRSVGEWPGVSLDAMTAPAIAMREDRAVVMTEVSDDVVDDLQLDGEAAELVRSMGVRSTLTVPLHGPEGTIGALAFGYVDSGRSYTDEDVPLALDLARRSGPTVDNALRYEHEQATASALQRNLLPERIPEVDGLSMAARYLPGSEGLKVGGDWYDVVPLPDGTVALAIGDVVGHGVRAAATMGRFRTALEFCLFDGAGSAAATIARVNRYVTTANEAEMATLLVLLLQPDTGEVRYASAGHLPAIVQSRDGSTRWLDGSRGVPLGVTETACSTEAHDRLEPGDLLVLYTDGLVERRTESLDVGFERLAAALTASPWPGTSPDAIADGLVSELLGERVRADDVALLVVGIDAAGMDPLDLTFRADARELSGLRSSLRAWLGRAGIGARAIDEVVLATNEVAANAVEHAYGLSDASFQLGVSIVDGGVAVVVEDRGSWRPPRPNEHRGRGLDLARAFMDAVEIESSVSGTVVRMTRVAEQIDETDG
jgi:PAS domain S-box-containing protein